MRGRRALLPQSPDTQYYARIQHRSRATWGRDADTLAVRALPRRTLGDPDERLVQIVGGDASGARCREDIHFYGNRRNGASRASNAHGARPCAEPTVGTCGGGGGGEDDSGAPAGGSPRRNRRDRTTRRRFPSRGDSSAGGRGRFARRGQGRRTFRSGSFGGAVAGRTGRGFDRTNWEHRSFLARHFTRITRQPVPVSQRQPRRDLGGISHRPVTGLSRDPLPIMARSGRATRGAVH